MHNLVYLIGRIVEDPKVIKNESSVDTCNIQLAVQRPFKNMDGVYETDFIDCVLWNAIANHTVEYCKKGDLVGIKGRLQNNTIKNEDGEVIKTYKTDDEYNGAFVFYDCFCQSEDGIVNWGHCGISLGEGQVIHAWATVRIDNFQQIEQLISPIGEHPRYIGWIPLARVLRQQSDR